MSETLRGALADHIIDIEQKRDLPKVRAKLEEMAKQHPEPMPFESQATDQLTRIADGIESLVKMWREEIARTIR